MYSYNTAQHINVLDSSTTVSSTAIKLPSLVLLLFVLCLHPLSKVLVKLDFLFLRLFGSFTLSTSLVEIISTLVRYSTHDETFIAILAFARWSEEVT